MATFGLRQLWPFFSAVLLVAIGAAGLAGYIHTGPAVFGVLLVLLAITAFSLGRRSAEFW